MEDSTNTFSLSAVSSSALICETSRDISAEGMMGVQAARGARGLGGAEEPASSGKAPRAGERGPGGGGGRGGAEQGRERAGPPRPKPQARGPPAPAAPSENLGCVSQV